MPDHPDAARSPPSNDDRVALEDRITQLFRRIDRIDPTPVSDLVTGDAVFDLGMEGVPVSQGRDTIAALLGSFPTTRTTRHMWTGFSIIAHDLREVSAEFQVLVCAGAEGAGKASHVCDVQVTFRRDGAAGVWQFSAMTRRVVLVLS